MAFLTKRIKNNTGSTIEILGATIAPTEYYEIPYQHHIRWASYSPLRALIQSQDIVVNDGTNDLTVDQGLVHIDTFPGDANKIGGKPVSVASVTDAQLLKYSNSAGGWITVDEDTVGKPGDPRYVVNYAYQGGSSNQWLELFRDISSDEVPFVIPTASTIKEISSSAKEYGDNGDVHFRIYKNGSLFYTYIMEYPNLAFSETGLNLSLAANDKLSVYVRDKSSGRGEVEYPFLSIFIQVN